MRERYRLWRSVGWAVAAAWVVVFGGWRVWLATRQAPTIVSVGTAASALGAQATLVPDTYPAPAAGTVALAGGTAPNVTLEATPAAGGADAGAQEVRVGPVAGEVTALAWLPSGTTAAEARALGTALRAREPNVVRIGVAASAKVAGALGPGWTAWVPTGTALTGASAYGMPSKFSGPPVAYVLTSTGKLAYMGVITGRSVATSVATDVRALARTHTAVPESAAPLGPGSFSLTAIEPGGQMGHVAVGDGHGTILVDFFATWCHACNEDMAVLKGYSAVAHSEGLPPVVGVDLRLAEPSTAYVKAFAARKALPFPVALDTTGQVTDQYRVSDIPVLALVSARGKVLWKHVGLVSQKALIQMVRSAATRT